MAASKRKQTPDVLAALLNGREAEPPKEEPKEPEAKEEAPEEEAPKAEEAQEQPAAEAPKEEPAEQPTSKPSRQPARRPARRQARKKAPPPEPEEEEKDKATFYLSLDTLDALEAGRLQLRRLAGRAKRRQINKSLMVETALQIVLQELEEDGAESSLARRLVGE